MNELNGEDIWDARLMRSSPTRRDTAECPVCDHPGAQHLWDVSGYRYFECGACESLFIDPDVLEMLDRGGSLVSYDEGYWYEELQSARDRAYGSSLARVAEAILYARRDIDVFLDVGSGPGFLLDALAAYLPNARDVFFGIEKFPPSRLRSSHAGLVIGEVDQFPRMVDAGSCIEVLEHLTPSMFGEILRQLASISRENALFIFNTGLPSYVKGEDRGYLDPIQRGHVVSYSVTAVDLIARRHGFRACGIPGKTWAFILEKTGAQIDDLSSRIWTPTPRNRELLHDPQMGSAMYILGLETARAYR